MKNSNIILSVIIVLCIAAGVTAYGLANPEDSIFTNLSGFTPGEDSIDDGNTQNTGDGGSGANGGSGSGSNSGGGSGVSTQEAKNIANTHILEEGCYAGNPILADGTWYIPVIDQGGNAVGEICVDAATGEVTGGAGGVK